jgi:hypothetical protein
VVDESLMDLMSASLPTAPQEGIIVSEYLAYVSLLGTNAKKKGRQSAMQLLAPHHQLAYHDGEAQDSPCAGTSVPFFLREL